MRTPPIAAWTKISAVRLLAVLPRGDRVEHVLGGKVERINRVPLEALELDDDALDVDVLSRLVELDAVPRHDELIAGDVGRDERLADRLRVGRPGPVDGIEEREHAGDRARGVVVELLAVA